MGLIWNYLGLCLVIATPIGLMVAASFADRHLHTKANHWPDQRETGQD